MKSLQDDPQDPVLKACLPLGWRYLTQTLPDIIKEGLIWSYMSSFSPGAVSSPIQAFRKHTQLFTFIDFSHTLCIYLVQPLMFFVHSTWISRRFYFSYHLVSSMRKSIGMLLGPNSVHWHHSPAVAFIVTLVIRSHVSMREMLQTGTFEGRSSD